MFSRLSILSMLLTVVFAQAALSAIVIRPGEATNVRGEVVVCDGGGESRQDVKWFCACYDTRGKNRGNVFGIWAPEDQQSAERQGLHACRRQKQQPIASVSCFRQNF